MYSPRREQSSKIGQRAVAGGRVLPALCLIGIVPWLFAPPAAAQNVPKLSRDAYMSVLTIMPGKPMYSAFGHTAIRVRDDSLGIDAVYNFGTFDFDTDWFYLKFARGLLDYRLARNHFEDVMSAYSSENRPIIEQRLDLNEQERQILVLRLEDNYLPKNRFYRYDFFFDNCSTRPRDVIESVVGDRVLGGDGTGKSTFRDLIDPYIVPRPWTHLGIDILLGKLTDQPASDRERLFLPDGLKVALESASVNDHLVSPRTDTLFWPRRYESGPVTPLSSSSVGSRGSLLGTLFDPMFVFMAMLLFGIAVLVVPIGKRSGVRYFDAALFLVAGVTGLVILFLWFGTQHTVTGNNWNILWALPTHLAAGVALFRNRLTGPVRVYFWVTATSCACLLAGWQMIGQGFHAAIIPLTLLLLVRAIHNARRTVNEYTNHPK